MTPPDAAPPVWSLRSARLDDGPWIAEIRAVVLFDDLDRLGRYSPVRVRERFLTAFAPDQTRVIQHGGRDVGTIAVRPEPDGLWIEHFYLEGALHGRGIGSAVLRSVLEDAGSAATFRLNVLRGSAAIRLYDRVGFVLESEDDVDLYFVRPGRVAPEE